MLNDELCAELEKRSGVKGYLVARALVHLGPAVLEVLNKGGAVALGSVGTFKRGKFRQAREPTIKGKHGTKSGTIPAHHPVIFKVAKKFKKLP